MARAPRNAKTDVTADSATENTESVNVDEVPAPATSDYPSEPNPENDVVPADEAGPVFPEGASRAHKAAIKRHFNAAKRLSKLDARAAKAEKEYNEAQALVSEKRPGYAADVAAALVDVEYHATRAQKVEAARSASYGAAQARAAGDNELATALDEKAENENDAVDEFDDVTAHPTNAGHVEFE